MEYVTQSQFIETTCLVCNADDKADYDKMGINFNDFDVAALSIRKEDVSAFRAYDERSTWVGMANGVEFVVQMNYEDFKRAMT